MQAMQPRWYDDIATVLAEESDYLAEIRETNRILMERALGTVCGACGGAGVIRRDTERDDIRLTSYAACPECDGTGEPVTDAALLDDYLGHLAARQMATNDHTEG